VLILGIDTATDQVGVAIGGHEGVRASAHVARGRRHAETLAPTVDFVRRQAGIELRDLGAVTVDVGPGLFTGLRVGVTTAKTIAQTLRLPMIGITSLDLLAFPVRFTPRLIAAAVDARRGEVFYALYRTVPGGVQQVVKPTVGPPGELASEIQARGGEWLLVGDGAVRWREDFVALDGVEIADQGLAHPSAASLVQLAHPRAMREEFVNAWELEPVYLRPPDAQIDWSKIREGAA
jgi:tRNA threonylcarbamoyladenosine biosynthesis protein TsaB